ncbi:hypothetical protein IHE44_0007291 [Lamprotornis superbus]|uniref:Proteasome beta subunit C-terminal domain-containing protein n=1 Tax=Lamprotornis superbus TaxID=245042 RepID=A0A835NWB4_9PASS|nr:hypothetical protein IHE44_0007291 [Lamprotornis superbus]
MGSSGSLAAMAVFEDKYKPDMELITKRIVAVAVCVAGLGSSDRLQMSPVFISAGDQRSGSGVAAALIPPADTAALMTLCHRDHLLRELCPGSISFVELVLNRKSGLIWNMPASLECPIPEAAFGSRAVVSVMKGAVSHSTAVLTITAPRLSQALPFVTRSTKITLVCNKSSTVFCQLSEELLAYQDFIARNTKRREEEAKQLVRDAIAAGIYNDLGSGSNIDICVISKNKLDFLRPYDVANRKGDRFGRYKCEKGTTAVLTENVAHLELEIEGLANAEPSVIAAILDYTRQF